MKYDDTSAFHWNTKLTLERQTAIIAWVKSLPKDKQNMIEEMIEDTKQEEYFNANYKG